jgi:hypothetical protein
VRLRIGQNAINIVKYKRCKMDKSMVDDKSLVIICATILGGLSMYLYPPDVSQLVVTAIVSGLFGVAVGRNL